MQGDATPLAAKQLKRQAKTEFFLTVATARSGPITVKLT